jgi:tetratricopeptide (TPR) repeat protein
MDASFSADDHFRRGLTALEENHSEEAARHFREAHRLEPSSPRYRSYHGLCVGLTERRFDQALELCRAAAKEEFFNPALYHNLARVHLSFGFKAEAIRYLRRGLMIDPGHAPMTHDLERLGTRRRPFLGFLPRRHPMNRLLGRCRKLWVQRRREEAPSSA